MNLKKLTYKDIYRECQYDNAFYKGENYYLKNAVSNLRNGAGTYQALVKGQSDYEAGVNYDSEYEITGFTCSCPAYEAYPGPCKHLVALLFSIRNSTKDEGNGTPAENSPVSPVKETLPETEINKTNRFIDSFEQLYVKQQETYHEREPLEVEYVMSLQSTFSERFSGSIDIELKVGPRRLYIVKDIPELLRAVEEDEAIKFSKLFTYHPSDYYFKKEDIEIFRLMSRIIEMKHGASDSLSFSYRRRVAAPQRSFTIPPSYAVEFLSLLQYRTVIVEDGFSSRNAIELTEAAPVLQFEVEEDGERSGIYRMTWTGADFAHYFGKKYGLLYMQGTFYLLKGPQLEAFDAIFFQMVLEEPAELLLDQSQLETFASVVLPRLNELGEVSLSHSIRKNIQMSPLVPMLYLDYKEGRVTAEVTFQYGEVKMSPFQPGTSEGDQLIVRDMEKEYYLLSFIEDIPFKFNGNELFLDEMEQILDFAAEDVPRLSELFHVYATPELRNIVHQPAERPAVKVETDEKLNLLEVAFEVDGIPEEELNSVIQSLLANKKYYRLSSGAYLHLENDEFKGMKQLLENLDVSAKEASSRSRHPLYRAFQLEEMSEVQLKKDRAFKKLVERLTDPEELDFPIPSHLENTLRDYQKRGFQWLMSLSYYGFGGILADDMGLGKTLQTIAYLHAAKTNGTAEEPALIICPSSVVYNWQKEIERFAPNLTSAVISGPSAEREEILNSAEDCDVWITSYPLIRRDVDHYKTRTFSTMVLDEAQYVKNQGTLTAKAVRMIHSVKSFALSGTPIENSLDELHSIFSIVQPGLFKNRQVYKDMDENRIAKRVKPFVLRRMKQDVLAELPDKIESVEYTHLTGNQKAVYLGQLQMLQSEASEAIQSDTLQENRMKILAGLTRLRQICCHPGMFLDDYKGGSGKLERLMEYLEEARDSGKRIVLFSQFTQMLSIMKERLAEAGWDYFYLDGATPGKERVTLADRFNEGEKNLFLVSLKAGGTGLNLTGGDTVILFDSWWNPAVEEQAADRVYRFGQKRVVQVTKMITTGTIEEKIHKLQEKKRDLLDRVIQPGETMISSLGKEDIEDLLDLKYADSAGK
ncbi:DEAD/DEAH box helicase [Salipaludibacillus sp. CUR1]|uniref:DEAD/DEAH box helicase n=1 Tax=Salipaludibacillus sp. CUR1 TaxID=2820003 RepID=UPI001E483F9E|nr:SNF2 helicase associated domain-containing protein [Salipaludibacillus sp. CUR1]MCE7791632.1 DEAD/DEAH box helicase [Salipaludibacillus sp. CUR1]